jgi:hypothetical protein
MQALGFRSESAVCRKAGVPIDVIRDIRRGKSPGIERVIALATALECSIAYLAFGEAGAALDEHRMRDVLTNLMAWYQAGGTEMDPSTFAELALHLYRSGSGPLRSEELPLQLMRFFSGLPEKSSARP